MRGGQAQWRSLPRPSPVRQRDKWRPSCARRRPPLNLCRLTSAGARILGVEITSDALSVADEPFDGPTVLMMGNEGHGLTDKQKAVCDGFVYIPHFGNGTASLNVSVAAGVVMHRFASWARYTEHKREEGADKFLVEKGPDPATRPRTEAELALREERRARREAKAAEAAAQGSSSSSSSAAAEATA